MEDGERNQSISSGGGRISSRLPVPNGPRGSRHLRPLVDALCQFGTMQRPDIATRLGISKQTVSELVAALEADGFVSPRGPVGGLPGRSAMSYELVADASVCLGIDLGGTKITFALADLLGTPIAESTEPTDTKSGLHVLDQVTRGSAELCRVAGMDRSRLRACVIGIPAAVHPASGRISLAGNLPGLDDLPLAEMLSRSIGCPVLLENDVNLALAGEVAAGVARGKRNVAFVALGTGIGAGVMVDGHLLRGAHGGVGEVAYLPFPGGQPDADTIRQGQLEAAVGSAGIMAAYRANGGERAVDVRTMFEAAAAGEQGAIAVLGCLSAEMARCVAALAAIADPEVVVLGGGIGAREELRSLVADELARNFVRPVSLVTSAHGARATVVGAIDQARERMLTALFGPA